MQLELRNVTGLFKALGLSKSHFGGRGYTRTLVLIRDGFTCLQCQEFKTPLMLVDEKGKKKLHDIHHTDGVCGKKSRKSDKIEEMNTLVTLCHSCHYRSHDFSKRVSKVWGEFGKKKERKRIYKWGLTKEEQKIKAPSGV